MDDDWEMERVQAEEEAERKRLALASQRGHQSDPAGQSALAMDGADPARRL